MASEQKVEDILKDLKKKRGFIKCRLTNFKKYVSSFENVELSVQQRAELKLRIPGAQNLLNDFNQVQGRLEDLSPASEFEKLIESRAEFEKEYYVVLGMLDCMVNPESIGERSINRSFECFAGNESNVHSGESVKLPTISIPSFDGSNEHWIEFRDTFMSLIHNSKTIPEIQKFHYLKASLKGDAKEVIENVEFSSSNYQVAWELLLHRFNNSRLIIQSHIKAIFSIPPITKESSIQLNRLIDTILKHIRSLKILGEPTEHWDTLIIYIVVSKLDPASHREWEQYKGTFYKLNTDNKIHLSDLLDFLKEKADLLTTITVSHTSKFNNSNINKKSNFNHNGSKVHCNLITENSVSNRKINKKVRSQFIKLCLMCNSQHPLYSCQKFLDLNAQEKFNFINDKKLCINCLRFGHAVETCHFGPCRKCEQKHNSLICDAIQLKNNTVTLTATMHGHGTSKLLPPVSVSHTDVNSCCQQHAHNNNMHAHGDLYDKGDKTFCLDQIVMLSTAIVEVCGQSGHYYKARAILDNGSECSFISQSLCNKLKTRMLQSTQHIHGVGNSITLCSQSCSIELKSRDGSFNTRIQCLVLPQITSKLPIVTQNFKTFNFPRNLFFADPTFYERQDIDLLLGADVFWDLLADGKIRLDNGAYCQNTKLGWIVSGVVQSTPRKQKVKHINCNLISQSCESRSTDDNNVTSLDKLVRNFWELEELPSLSKDLLYSNEESACEEHFSKTTKRLSNGRYCVSLPLKFSPKTLGNTREQATKRFYALEKRLELNPSYKVMYRDFIHEYISLGHMSLAETYSDTHYFLPHHGVFRQHATTTKLRVVFDASMPSSTGISLNDLQMIGPAIQGDLISILLRFREHRYVASADIEKFYRQIHIAKEDRDLQLILWRDSPSDQLKVYRLNTVTYGTASAPYLSCRCLKDLAQNYCEDPHIASIINNSFYVDDLIASHNSKAELDRICEGINNILSTACINLRKWIYNYDRDSLTPTVCADNNNVHQISLFDKNVQNKTLGIGWDNGTDEIHYLSQVQGDKDNNNVITKRLILSSAAQIYDPLGLLSPIITIAKTLLQKCWLLKLEWDEPVPDDISQIWNNFVDGLSHLSCLRIPRHVMCIEPTRTELHIFTDASQIAYGACAFVRTISSSLSDVTVHLLCSKGKVAPTKPTTIPRLELCGALLGARLYHKLKSSLRSTIDEVVFWTDSTIVLGWLGMPINLLKPYVQNRTAEIHELTKEHAWRHVAGKDNPADLVSRGQGLLTVSSSSLWWNGPTFLHDINFEIPNIKESKLIFNDLPETKQHDVCCHTVSQSNNYLFNFSRFSQYIRLKRTAAYVIRFIYNARHVKNKRTGSLSVEELNCAELTLAMLSQRDSFIDIFNLIKNQQPLKGCSQLSKLNLFIDSNNLIRVGGRIQNSSHFGVDKKFPILISAKHDFSILLFRFEHQRLLHAGPQHLLFSLREMWWPVGGRNLARMVVRSCVRCTRWRPTTLTPIMGNLPKERLDPGFPFLRCGVDYAGPVFTLNRKGRGAKLQKSYICLFICLVTRAVHLELVSDLSTDGYLLALKRFIGRRGKPCDIFSDNGKNFVGLMNDFKKFLDSCSHELKEYAISQNIKFKMIPSYASHFGGLWEAGVKSCKHHLRRVVGNAHLTFEEFSTVLVQIEAILNSRPLTPLSTDPDDFLPLSPAHFLVGRPLTTPVTAEVHDVPAHRLRRYQRIEQIRQHFWKRWSQEYVSELQTRSKWQQNNGELKEGMLVLIKDDNLPPMKWSLGRIVKTYPGRDGVSRVADIRKADGVVRRAFSKICPLLPSEF